MPGTLIYLWYLQGRHLFGTGCSFLFEEIAELVKQSIEGPHSNQLEGNANFCNSLFCFVLFDSKVLTNTQIVQSDSLSFSSSVLFHNLHACTLVHFQEFKYILINGQGLNGSM